MNKRELSKVFSRLAKEEVNLGTHRVDLALKDFDKYESEVKDISNKINKENSEFESQLEKTKQIRSRLSQLSVLLSKVDKKIEDQMVKDVKAAKDLGIDGGVFYKKGREIKSILDKAQRKAEDNIQRIKR